MYIQRINRKDKKNAKIYTSIILARSYREKGKQKREIIATLTKWPTYLISALEEALKNKEVPDLKSFSYNQGKAFGALLVINELCKRLGIINALDRSKYAKITLLQIMARILNQGSQRSILDWINLVAVDKVIGIEQSSLSLKNLYDNLSTLANRQRHLEDKLYKYSYPNKSINLYLYDVTSSYFEGEKNELAAYGYNRDKKQGKKQIVIGLLCADDGDPISVEVFTGNTSDIATFVSQLNKLKQRFKVNKVVMVGDKGIIKSSQIEQIEKHKFDYITSISKAQIKTLLKQDTIQLDMFDEEQILDVQDGNIRYVLHRNKVRMEQIQANRNNRIDTVKQLVAQANQYLADHSRAKTTTQIKNISARIEKLKLIRFLSLEEHDNSLSLVINQQEIQEAEKLDGCYVIKTSLTANDATSKTVHDRYKDLAKVEYAFKNIKTEMLEVRPIYLRRADRTKGHVFVCMLAYKVIRHLRNATKELNMTLKTVLNNLNAISYIKYDIDGIEIKQLPSKLSDTQQKILDILDIEIPKTL